VSEGENDPVPSRDRWHSMAIAIGTATGLALLLSDRWLAPHLFPHVGVFLLPIDEISRVHDAVRVLALLAFLLGLFIGLGRLSLLALGTLVLLAGPFFPGDLPILTGDEPHYIIIAQSLQRDHDLGVRDEYEHPLTGYAVTPALGSKNGAPGASDFSIHEPGVAILALPGWVLGGPVEGRRWALIGITGAALLLIREMYRLARGFGASRRSAGIGTALIVVTPPVLLLSRQVYPEIPAALCLCHLARRLKEDPEALSSRVSRSGGQRWRSAVAGLAAATLPWLHVRFLLAATIFVVALAIRQRLSMRFVPLAMFCASLVLMAVFFDRWYGSPLPNAPYAGTRYRGTEVLRPVVGLLVDMHVGLLFVAPIVVLSLCALPAVWRHSRSWLMSVGLAVAVSFIADATYITWHLGLSTPGRFWAALVPLSVPLAALAVERLPKAAMVAGAWGFAYSALCLAFPYASYPNGLNEQPVGGYHGTVLWGALHLRFLPELAPPSTGTIWPWLLLLTATSGAVVALSVWGFGRSASGEQLSGP
jgi:hypothetical protein